ncbi:hypothetical protein FS837_000745 [Tulasnella sp. UAMH 9824]|nr:hypothetical protein FS837_000745 [Tulasnella sp. UAMH 9824]
MVPPYFYEDIAKAGLGCQALSDKAYFVAEFAHAIRQYGTESKDLDLRVKLESVSWAVGNIRAAPGTLPFFGEQGIIPNILGMIGTSPIRSVRGSELISFD